MIRALVADPCGTLAASARSITSSRSRWSRKPRAIDCSACGAGHFVRRERLNFGRTFVGDGYGDAFASNVIEDELVLLLDAFAEILDSHRLLGDFNIERPAMLLEFHQASPLRAEIILAFQDFAFLELFL